MLDRRKSVWQVPDSVPRRKRALVLFLHPSPQHKCIILDEDAKNTDKTENTQFEYVYSQFEAVHGLYMKLQGQYSTREDLGHSDTTV